MTLPEEQLSELWIHNKRDLWIIVDIIIMWIPSLLS